MATDKLLPYSLNFNIINGSWLLAGTLESDKG